MSDQFTAEAQAFVEEHFKTYFGNIHVMIHDMQEEIKVLRTQNEALIEQNKRMHNLIGECTVLFDDFNGGM